MNSERLRFADIDLFVDFRLPDAWEVNSERLIFADIRNICGLVAPQALGKNCTSLGFADVNTVCTSPAHFGPEREFNFNGTSRTQPRRAGPAMHFVGIAKVSVCV